ncbi:hypothetical protein [Candidatus Nitrosotenuis aquarius]|uniref:hypothetical protein n=1 Tax=Candidatus Nitrosotenuis aquarius TaxID=1846278 RepID=UPI000C1F913D|nr:hypothetical protein [Candidatus Nitrosotenuis aquarius]
MTPTFAISLNWESYTKDPILAKLEECDQKLKFAVWEFMEYLSEEMKCDHPFDIIKLIKESVDQSISKYSPMDESFDDGFDVMEFESEEKLEDE